MGISNIDHSHDNSRDIDSSGSPDSPGSPGSPRSPDSLRAKDAKVENDLREANARLETLELKIMELENTVSELNEVILTQYRDHQTLTTVVAQLNARLSQMSDASGGDDKIPSAADEIPPHY